MHHLALVGSGGGLQGASSQVLGAHALRAESPASSPPSPLGWSGPRCSSWAHLCWGLARSGLRSLTVPSDQGFHGT